jgi:hypothetical protein
MKTMGGGNLTGEDEGDVLLILMLPRSIRPWLDMLAQRFQVNV